MASKSSIPGSAAKKLHQIKHDKGKPCVHLKRLTEDQVKKYIKEEPPSTSPQLSYSGGGGTGCDPVVLVERLNECVLREHIPDVLSKDQKGPPGLRSGRKKVAPKPPESLIQVTGDGNCLFRALSVALYKKQRNFMTVRKKIVNYISLNWNIFHSFCDQNTPEEYVAFMGQNGTFGTSTEIQAACIIYKRTIVVICNGKVIAEYVHPSSKPIFLHYSGSGLLAHYNVFKIPPTTITDTDTQSHSVPMHDLVHHCNEKEITSH